MLDSIFSQPTKFRTKKWFEINHDLRGTYNTNSKIRFKTSVLRSSDYIDGNVLVKGTISIAAQAGYNPNNANKKVVLKNCLHLLIS